MAWVSWVDLKTKRVDNLDRFNGNEESQGVDFQCLCIIDW